MNKIIKNAFVNSFTTFVYIIIIVSFIFSLEGFFKGSEDNIIVPIFMLLLFVCSAAITGFLVFGRPIMLYIDGKKKEAISLLIHTLGMLIIITLTTFILLILYFNIFGR